VSSATLGKLELFEADLLTDGSFDEAVSGAQYVFHTASPFFIKASMCTHAMHRAIFACSWPAVRGRVDKAGQIIKAGRLLQPENDPHKELIEPAVHGTKNLLQSVAKSKATIKRVVLTSSVAGRPQNTSLLHACAL
jgi:hypothetical protein